MSEAFVDVMWRGLEVGKRVKLRAVHVGDAYVDHTTPMPVGSALVIRTDEGVEIGVVVKRVHEQVGGSSEVPGMLVVPAGAGLGEAARAWWATRVEVDASGAGEAPLSTPTPSNQPPPPPSSQPVVASPAALLAAAVDAREEIASRPTLTMSTVEVERALAASGDDAATTDVMPVMTDDGLVDDGRRTMVMSAADVSAIVEQAEAETNGGVEEDGPSGDGPTGDGPSGDGPAGGAKKKKGRRSKRR